MQTIGPPSNFVDQALNAACDGDVMAWVAPKFTRAEVNEAGQHLINPTANPENILWAFDVVNNWRGVHAGPLNTVKMTLTNRAKALDSNAITSQRTKRIPAIQLKLTENHKAGMEMKLTQMHDIGGCRAIFKEVDHVEELLSVYTKATKKNKLRGGTFVREYNYISAPKPTGYRGIHLVYKYHSEAKEKEIYNGLKIEIQIRSLLQHYWATAVETVDFFTGQALKSNIGELPWKRFFVLVANELARLEVRPLVPGAPDNPVDAIEELKKYSDQIKALEGFQAAATIVSAGAEFDASQSYFLVELDLEAKSVRSTGFRADEIAKAQEKYKEAEAAAASSVAKPNLQTVLVSVDSLANLSKAYPSFYLDVSEFVKALKDIIAT